MAKTKIEWCTHSWSPITGCTPVSSGCLNCYAKRMAKRLAGRFGYPRVPNHFKPTYHPNRLKEPARWKKPRMVFVCSMSDLFHEEISIDTIYSIMRKMQGLENIIAKHVYLILTKRPERMREIFKKNTAWLEDNPHVWLGVSCEDQENFDKRVPILLEIPSAIHYVSLEPLLGPIDMSSHAQIMTPNAPSRLHVTPIELLDWVICGSESGPGARPMDQDWVREIRDQCSSVKCEDCGLEYIPQNDGEIRLICPECGYWNIEDYEPIPFLFKQDIINGKKVGLPELDGRVWNEFPPLPNETEPDDDRSQPQLLFI